VIAQQPMELIADALVRGSTIALLAVGLTLVYSTMRFANVAHVEFATVGAYAAISLSGVFIVPVAGIIGLIVAVALGAAVYELVFRRLLAMGEMSAMIGSLAVSVVVQAVIQLVYGSRPRDLPRELERANTILGAAVTPSQVQLVAVSVCALVLTGALLRSTPLGRKVRAVAADGELARVSGVGERKVVAAVWAISGGLAAISGIELALESSATPALGFNLLLPVFSAAIVGGLGSALGAVIASYGVALLEAIVLALDVGGGVIPVSYRPAIGFVFLILALIFRPQGLLGARIRLV
jgi:branched-subunit amino acid ABC-type transport system permease component